MQKTNALLIGMLALLFGAIMIVAMTKISEKNDSQDRFSVTGSGTVYAKADIANINVGLRTQTKSTPAEATSENAEKMNAMIGELKKMGIEEKDIKTNDYNLNPIYNWSENNGQELKGYEISQTLYLKVRELDKISQVITKTTELGANQIGNINFTIDDEFELRNQARELAIGKAKEKAQIIAKQTGIELGKIVNVYESEPTGFLPYANAKMEADGRGGEMSQLPEIQTGQNEIKVDVTLSFEVN